MSQWICEENGTEFKLWNTYLIINILNRDKTIKNFCLMWPITIEQKPFGQSCISMALQFYISGVNPLIMTIQTPPSNLQTI